MKKHTFQVGDVVKLTSKFLKSTGQYVGGEGHKKWSVLHVDDNKYGSTFITVDERHHDTSYWTADELAADPMLKYRRINAANLMLANKPDYSGM
jgi:hypothetical protein